MDFCAALEQAIDKAPNSQAAEKLRRMVEDCRKKDGGVSTQGSGPTSPPPPPPGKKPPIVEG